MIIIKFMGPKWIENTKSKTKKDNNPFFNKKN